MFVDRLESFTPEDLALVIKKYPKVYLVIFLHFDDDGKVYRLSGIKRTSTSWVPFYSEIYEEDVGDYLDPVKDLSVAYLELPVIEHSINVLNEYALTSIGRSLIESGGRKGLILRAFETKYSKLSLFILYGSKLVFDKNFFSIPKVLTLDGEKLLEYLSQRVMIFPSKDSKENYNFTQQVYRAIMDLYGFDSESPLKKWKLSFHEKVCKIIRENNLTSPEEVVEFFMYENMKERYPDFCPLYKENKTCHEKLSKDSFNCFFCACPHFISSLYNKTEKKFGGCSLNSKNGLYNEYGYWDCTKCYFVHHPRYALRYLRENPWTLDSICWKRKDVKDVEEGKNEV